MLITPDLHADDQRLFGPDGDDLRTNVTTALKTFVKRVATSSWYPERSFEQIPYSGPEAC